MPKTFPYRIQTEGFVEVTTSTDGGSIYGSWQVFDSESVQPSQWGIEDENLSYWGWLKILSDSHGYTGRYNSIDLTATNYTFETTVVGLANDNDGIGVHFRFTDRFNHYMVLWNGGGSQMSGFGPGQQIQFLKRVNGNLYSLATRGLEIWTPDTPYRIKVECNANHFIVSIDDEVIFDVTDNNVVLNEAPLFYGAFGPLSYSTSCLFNEIKGPVRKPFVISTDSLGIVEETQNQSSSAALMSEQTVYQLVLNDINTYCALSSLDPTKAFPVRYTLYSGAADVRVCFDTSVGNKVTTSATDKVWAWWEYNPSMRVPAAPIAFFGLALSHNSIRWAWSRGDINEEGYALVDEYGRIIAEISGGTTLIYTETNLKPATTYTRRVMAKNAIGYSSVSNIGIVVTLEQPAVKPVTPTDFVGIPNGSTSIAWTWANADENPIRGFRVYATLADIQAGNELAELPATATQWIESGLTTDTQYTRYVVAYNTLTNSDPVAAVAKTLILPSETPIVPFAPIGFHGQPISDTELEWSWDTYPSAIDVLGFRLYDIDDTLVMVFPSDARGYAEKWLTPDTAYTYKIRAFNIDGESPDSNRATLFTLKETTTVPGTPDTIPADELLDVEKPSDKILAFKSGIGDRLDLLVKRISSNLSEEYATYDLQVKSVKAVSVPVYLKKDFQFRFVGSGLKADGTQWSATSDWYDGSINNAQALHANEGKADLTVPISLTVPDGISAPSFWVETDPVGTAKYYFHAGNSDGTTSIADDFVTFFSNEMTAKTVSSSWYSAKVPGASPIRVVENEPLTFTAKVLNPTKDPTYVSGMTNFQLIINCHNPNVRLQLVTPYINWNTTSHLIDIPLVAKIINPTQTSWHPAIHHGYYYMNQAEYYLFANDHVEGRYVETQIPNALDLLYTITTKGQRYYPPQQIYHSDTDQADFNGAFKDDTESVGTVNTVATAFGDLMLVKSGEHYLTQGSYVSTSKAFGTGATSWQPIKWRSTIPNGATLKVYTRSSADQNTWSAWQEAQNLEPIPSPLDKYLQYKVKMTSARINVPYVREIIHTTQADFTGFDAALSANVTVTTGGFTATVQTNLMTYVSKTIDLGTELYSLDTLTFARDTENGTVQVWTMTSDSSTGPWDETDQKWTLVDVDAHVMSATKRYFRYKIIVAPVDGTSAPITEVKLNFKSYNLHTQTPVLHYIELGGDITDRTVDEDIIVPMAAKLPADMMLHTISQKTVRDTVADYITQHQISMENYTIPGGYIVLMASSSPTAADKAMFEYLADGSTYVQARSTERSLSGTLSRAKIFTNENDEAFVTPIPQQGSPVIVVGVDGQPMEQVAFYTPMGQLTLTNTEVLYGNGRTDYALSFLGIDPETLTVSVDRSVQPSTRIGEEYALTNHILRFKDPVEDGALITVAYRLKNSFYVDYNYDTMNGYARIAMHKPKLFADGSINVYHEASVDTAYYDAEEVELNPLRTTMNAGFIYVTDEVETAKQIEIKTNRDHLYSTGYDRTTILITLRDNNGNPVVGNKLLVSANLGTLLYPTLITDQSGLVSIAYIAPAQEGTDTLTVTDTSIGLTRTATLTILKQEAIPRLSITAGPVIELVRGVDYWSSVVKVDAQVINNQYQLSAGQVVTFSTNWGTLQNSTTLAPNTSVVRFDRTTDANGLATCYLSAKVDDTEDTPWDETHPFVQSPPENSLAVVTATTVMPNTGTILEASAVIQIVVRDTAGQIPV